MGKGIISALIVLALALAGCGMGAAAPTTATATAPPAAPATAAVATATRAATAAAPAPTVAPTATPKPTLPPRPTLAPTVAATAECTRARWPTAEWRTATPESAGMDAQMLADADAKIRADLPTVFSLLVVKDGDIVFEEYYQGSDATAQFGQRSVTKSILSAVFGIVRGQGFFPDLDQPISELMPEYFEGMGEGDARRDITLRHLLAMTAGFTWNELVGFGEPKPDSDWTREVLNLGMDARPGEKFSYNSAAMHLLSVLITRVTGRSASQWANTYLFEKIGMNPVGWPIDPQANSLGFSGLVFTSRDMARFGFLYLNQGCWDGEQIVPADWVRLSTTEHSPHPDGNGLGYGYLWWTTIVAGYQSYFAAGYGGQVIWVVPDLDLVAVMTGNPQLPPEMLQNTRAVIADYVIPSAAAP